MGDGMQVKVFWECWLGAAPAPGDNAAGLVGGSAITESVLASRVASLPAALSDPAPRAPRTTRPLRSIAELVLPADLPSVLPGGAELLVVPHGPLHRVPFAALPTGDPLVGPEATEAAVRERLPA